MNSGGRTGRERAKARRQETRWIGRLSPSRFRPLARAVVSLSPLDYARGDPEPAEGSNHGAEDRRGCLSAFVIFVSFVVGLVDTRQWDSVFRSLVVSSSGAGSVLASLIIRVLPDRQRSDPSSAAEADGHLLAIDDHWHLPAPLAEAEHPLEGGLVLFDVDVLELHTAPGVVRTGRLRVGSGILAEDVDHRDIVQRLSVER